MKPAGRDVIGNNPSAFSAQAAYDQDVRGNPDADENRYPLHPTPSVTVVNHGQVGWSPAPFFPPQPGHSTPAVGPTGVGPGTDRHRAAGPPMLREPGATNSAQGSGNREVDAISSNRAAGSSDPVAAEAASDRNYRSELAAWRESKGPDFRAIYETVEKRIHAYLDAPEKHAWKLDLSRANISTLPPLPVNLRTLDVSQTKLSALPANLPRGLQELNVSRTKLSALPVNLPEGLQKLDVSQTKLSALPANLPHGLQELDVSCTNLIALPANLPEGLQKLNVSCTNVIALPANLPEGLQKLDVSDTRLSTLPANLPHGLEMLNVRYTNINTAALLPLMQTNTSITKLLYQFNNPVLKREIKQELVNNRQHATRLANAAASLDLLTRLAFTTSDQTGSLIHRPATLLPVAGQLPERSIPAELHDVLAANSGKSLLAVLAGMVDGASQ